MLTIRELRRDDNFAELVQLSRQFFTEYESHHVDFFKIDTLKDQYIIDYFSRWLEHEDGVTFVAIDDGVIVGYITVYVREQPDFWTVKRIGDISGLMVAKSHRRQGVAAKLYQATLTFFNEKQVRYFTVFTAVHNQGALRFYEKQGLMPLSTTLIGEI